jgi:hypothetical protein
MAAPLKVCDIDSAQMVIRIEQGKGRNSTFHRPHRRPHPDQTLVEPAAP